MLLSPVKKKRKKKEEGTGRERLKNIKFFFFVIDRREQLEQDHIFLFTNFT
jgi:hypothetical protein